MNSVLAGLLLACTVGPAWSVTIYVFNGDADDGFIVDTATDSFTTFATSEADIGYNVAVTDRIVLGDRDDGIAAEYDLNGNFTGDTFPGGANFSQLLDGTTNGIDSNFGVECCGVQNSVTVADLNWQGQSVLFDISFEGSGITYDAMTGTLWVSGFDDLVRNFALGGAELNSFSTAAEISGSPCCMSYDEATDTLWIGENNSNVLYNYDKTGTLIDSVAITGWAPGNIFGAEIAISGTVLPATQSVPTVGAWGMVVLAFVLMVLAGSALRRRAG